MQCKICYGALQLCVVEQHSKCNVRKFKIIVFLWDYIREDYITDQMKSKWFRQELKFECYKNGPLHAWILKNSCDKLDLNQILL